MSINQRNSITTQFVKKVQLLHNGWEYRGFEDQSWKPASIPGCVHTDLLNNGLIDDPFYRDNEQKLQWIGKTDWCYRLIFNVKPELFKYSHIELVCDGLDTYADVYINGHPVLRTDNMFRQWRSNIKKIIKSNDNTIVLRFRSPINEILPKMESLDYTLPAANDNTGTSPHSRKAPFHYGWDWGPRFVTCGIWRPIYLEFWDHVKIQDMRVVLTELSEEKAMLNAEVEILSDSSKSVTVKLNDGSRTVSKNINLNAGINNNLINFEIPDPKLWWPNGFGEQPLYSFTAELTFNDTQVDSITKRMGLRTLELRQNDDQWGRSFEFVINGIPVFAKGGNWIPADIFLNRITHERYHRLLKSCQDANMNMLRVWGGGIYESNEFYDLCDEMGIMVWQDFMFACSFYPGDEDFLNNVEDEAKYNIKRLRHHPCIVLWCGNNEIEAGWQEWDWNKGLPTGVWDDYKKIFHVVLPQICARFDPSRPYWPSSPSSNLETNPQSQSIGDVHYWDVWHHAKPFCEYEKQHPRFMSEYGFQAFPSPKTVTAYTLPEDHDIESTVMMAHQKHKEGNQLIREYLLQHYREPKDFRAFLIVSQILQAEGIKIGAEHFRRTRPRCMGSLYWQINDCWPVASWASIDYYGVWKALHYYARDFYSPILVSPHLDDHNVSITIVSDRMSRTNAVLNLGLYDFDGNQLFTHKYDTNIASLSSAVYWQHPKSELLKNIDPTKVVLWCTLISNDEFLSTNRLYFVQPKAMDLPKPKISFEVVEGESGVEIVLRTDKVARNVYLTADNYKGHFSENFFDMLPTQTIKSVFKTENKIKQNDFKKDLRVISLVDMY